MMHTTHTHTAREGFCSNYNHTKPSHIQWRQWDEYFFFCKGSCDKGRDLCVLMFESWCVCYSVNCFYGWEREIKWVRERNRHTNPFLCPWSDCFSPRCLIRSEEERGEQFSVSNTRLAEFPLYTEALYEQNTRSISRSSICYFKSKIAVLGARSFT